MLWLTWIIKLWPEPLEGCCWYLLGFGLGTWLAVAPMNDVRIPKPVPSKPDNSTTFNGASSVSKHDNRSSSMTPRTMNSDYESKNSEGTEWTGAPK